MVQHAGLIVEPQRKTKCQSFRVGYKTYIHYACSFHLRRPCDWSNGWKGMLKLKLRLSMKLTTIKPRPLPRPILECYENKMATTYNNNSSGILNQIQNMQ